MSNLTAIISLKSDKVLDEPVWIIGAKWEKLSDNSTQHNNTDTTFPTYKLVIPYL